MTPRTPIQVINDWPGSGDRGERKVPTTLIYNLDGTISSWGFMCADDDVGPQQGGLGKTRREFFKIFLDEDTLLSAHKQGLSNAPRSTAEAQQFVTDYLRKIYEHIKETIEIQIGRRYAGGWDGMAVEFLFSVPTTWTSQEIINKFKVIIRDAGFAADPMSRHSAFIDLTEAESAAIATVKNSAVAFRMGDMFLSIDAGGGTTDLALMKLESADQSFPQVSQVTSVRGVGIGATLIDRAFIALVQARLAAVPEVAALFPPDYPATMARSHHFRTVKHKLGEKAYTQQVYKIQMEGVSHEFSHAGIGVENGRMVFSMSEIQSLFDVQIEGIRKKVMEQLDWLTANGRPEQVVQWQYFILSGGLGSSAYVRETLQRHFQTLRYPNAQQVAIIPCSDPQLVAVRGLLLDRQQRMQTGNVPVLASRIARASYGVVVSEVYSPALHFNEDVYADPFDSNMRWAKNQIQWLIKKGDAVYPNVPLNKAFEMRLGSVDAAKSWDTEIVISQNEPSFLPRSLKHGGAVKLCDVKSNLTGVQQHQLIQKHKRGTCFSKGHMFYICQFDVKVIVAPADLRFELWFGGQKFSGNHDPITVKWDQEGAKSQVT
ncbi:hypothetical protein GQ53DRAFT_737405 [Thozetella sp. PMI_491]|nr:hypothetical protein GQ53DRAFT_737405 [Thozetella sp. PMI_491]